MPDQGGMEAIPVLAKRCPQLPVIVQSSSEDPGDVRRAWKSGACGYVPKSASPPCVGLRLSVHAALRRLSRRVRARPETQSELLTCARLLRFSTVLLRALGRGQRGRAPCIAA